MSTARQKTFARSIESQFGMLGDMSVVEESAEEAWHAVREGDLVRARRYLHYAVEEVLDSAVHSICEVMDEEFVECVSLDSRRVSALASKILDRALLDNDKRHGERVQE